MRELIKKNKFIKEISKRGLYALSIPFYQVTSSVEEKYSFFLIPKTGISTILSVLRESTKPNIDELTVLYRKSNHADNFKFCFIRNPWDRLVSCYSNKVLRKKLYQECWNKDFEYFIHYLTKQHIPTSEGHIRLQSNSFPVKDIDYIGSFENFSKDFDYIINQKLKLNKQLVAKNPSKHEHYTEYYSDQSRRIVEELYKSDIELGNYKFGK